MKTLSNIKKDLEFNIGLSALIEVLKNISVSQFRALEKKVKSRENLLTAINSFFEFLNTESVDHPFLNPRNKLQIVVAVTSDSGLLGGLNNEVVNTALIQLEEIPGKLVVIGERGKAYAREWVKSFVAFDSINEEQQYGQAKQLRDYLLNKFTEESMGYLKVVYPRPITFTVQRVETVSFLPFRPEAKEPQGPPAYPGQVIFESLPKDIIGYLAYLWIEQKLLDIFVLSRLAEFAARFMHLEGCSQRLKEMDNKLRLQYFRVRHELIDRNMRELFSARLIYAR